MGHFAATVVVRQWCVNPDLIKIGCEQIPALSYRCGASNAQHGHIGCRDLHMHHAIAFIALGLLGALLSSVWLRRAELQFSGESTPTLLGLALCLVSVFLIVLAIV